MTRGKKKALVRISQSRRNHVIKRIKERFGNNIDVKTFFSNVKDKNYIVLSELKGNRLLCLADFYKDKHMYMILRYRKNTKEVATVLTEDMVMDKYGWVLEENGWQKR